MTRSVEEGHRYAVHAQILEGKVPIVLRDGLKLMERERPSFDILWRCRETQPLVQDLGFIIGKY